MIDFAQLLVGGVPLLIVVFGLVEFIKKIGLTGNWLTVASLVLGIVVGFLYRIAEIGPPLGFSAWFSVVFFGIALGLIASGLYDFANTRFPKNESKYNNLIR
jgi:hypothetical protein